MYAFVKCVKRFSSRLQNETIKLFLGENKPFLFFIP